MFNNCLEIGHFPDIFKIAHVPTLWKRSGLKSKPEMYNLDKRQLILFFSLYRMQFFPRPLIGSEIT